MRSAPSVLFVLLEPAPDTTAVAWSAIVASGPEAEPFVSGQLTQDVAGLREPRWSLVLQPDSTVVAPVWVTRRDGELALVLERPLAEVTLARLARFRLRVACALELVESVEGPFATLGARVDARWPGPPEAARALTPHSLGRRVLEATVSFTKGCYTGQELVGRLDARGARVPWRVVVARAASVEAIEAVLSGRGPEGPRGVTTAIERDGVVEALGVAHRTLGAGAYDTVTLSEVDEVASAPE